MTRAGKMGLVVCLIICRSFAVGPNCAFEYLEACFRGFEWYSGKLQKYVRIDEDYFS
jgi:hypothetical protein